MTLRSTDSTSILAVLLGISLLGAGCERIGLRRSTAEEPSAARRAPVTGLGPAALKLEAPRGGAVRILLDDRARTRLRESAAANSGAFQNVKARAEAALEKPIGSGYQGFEWGDAVANLSIAFHATNDARYAAGAIRYQRALLDDREQVGDGKGGPNVVSHDSGYGIRTFGAYAALGYDWLRGVPEFDATLKQRTIERLEQWLGWYAEKGYLKDKPIANYYWGYFTALSFAGLATAGESEIGDRFLQKARDELSNNVLPAFRDDLVGGGWPEGWQYGEYTGMEVALVARAFKTGAGIDVAQKLPWLGETVTHHVHALLPDERSVYDGGTWGEHPAKPSGLALSAISVALEGVDDARVAEARWLTAHAIPPPKREQAWVTLLADRVAVAERQPRSDAQKSLHLKGQGLTFARSDWTPNAVWTSFQAGPRLAEDHQHADQGHFVFARGGDGLLVDGGGSEGSATINHNTLLIDDGGEVQNYPPNQGVFGKNRVKTLGFADDGNVVVAVGDIGEAYAPACSRQGCEKRSVKKLLRTFVYVRPQLLVISDRVELKEGDYGASWAAHLTVNPTLSESTASAIVGASRVDVRVIEPRNAELVAPKEPTPSGEGAHRLNQPWGPMWRLEVRSPRGEKNRRFLHVITASEAQATPPPVTRLAGDGLGGAAVRVDGRRAAVLFAEDRGEGSVALGERSELVVIAGLTPGRRYQLRVDESGACTLHLRASGDGTPANPAGTLRTSAEACVRK
jgi:hypothetical protein